MSFNDGLSREKTSPLIYIKNQLVSFYMIMIFRVCVYQQNLVIFNMIYLCWLQELQKQKKHGTVCRRQHTASSEGIKMLKSNNS